MSALRSPDGPIPMLIWCPMCKERHIDRGEFATKPHHTHSCQRCGLTWRPAVVPTVGVQYLPGFKDDADERSRAEGAASAAPDVGLDSDVVAGRVRDDGSVVLYRDGVPCGTGRVDPPVVSASPAYDPGPEGA